jgi:hypothetical protein
MKKHNFLLFISAALLFVSCAETQADKEQKIEKEMYKEVMLIHDEAMPWMDDIFMLKEELGKVFDESLGRLLLGNESKMMTINITMEMLDEADEAMMQWMRSFKSEFPQEWTHQQKIEYLQSEKQKITQVRAQMKDAIEKGNELLNELR